MRFFYDNELDKTGVIVTPSSEVSTLPAINILNEFKSKPWRTGTSVATETLVMNLGSAKAITSIILHGHTLTSGDTTIKVEANSADAWGAPPFTQALTFAANTIGQVFGSQSFQFWRLSFTKSAAGVSRDIGRIHLGTYYETTEQPDHEGYSETLDDVDRQTRSLGGQVYTEVVNGFNTIRADFSKSPHTQVDSIKTVAIAVRRYKSFFIQTDTVTPLDTFYYVKLKKTYARSVAGMDSNLIWNVGLEMEEQV
jgi:hypothetical protein